MTRCFFGIPGIISEIPTAYTAHKNSRKLKLANYMQHVFPCAHSSTTDRVASRTRNSSGDEIANVNFLYNDIVHAVQDIIDSCIHSSTDRRGYTQVYQIQ